MRLAKLNSSPFTETGTPALNSISTYSGVSGAFSGEVVMPKASSGASFHGFSKTPHSLARPKGFGQLSKDCPGQQGLVHHFPWRR